MDVLRRRVMAIVLTALAIVVVPAVLVAPAQPVALRTPDAVRSLVGRGGRAVRRTSAARHRCGVSRGQRRRERWPQLRPSWRRPRLAVDLWGVHGRPALPTPVALR